MIFEKENVKNITLYKGNMKFALPKAILNNEKLITGYDRIIIIDNNDNEIALENEGVQFVSNQPMKIAV